MNEWTEERIELYLRMRNERMSKESKSRPEEAPKMEAAGPQMSVFKTAAQRNYEAQHVHRKVSDKELFASIPQGSGFCVQTVVVKGKAKRTDNG